MEVRFGHNFADNEPGLLKPGCLAEPKPPPGSEDLKAAQEEINKEKAEQECINMLLTKANVFQNELYNFTLKSKEIQAKIQCDVDLINSNIDFKSIDELQVKKACSIGNLITVLKNLKEELVGAKAYLVEIRKQAKDAPSLETTTEQLTPKQITQKLRVLNDALFYKIVQMKWVSAEVKADFSREKLLKDIMSETLVRLNVKSEPPLQPSTSKYKHSSSSPEQTSSTSEMIAKLNNMISRLSKLSCESSTSEVPTSTPAPSDNPLPKQTFTDNPPSNPTFTDNPPSKPTLIDNPPPKPIFNFNFADVKSEATKAKPGIPASEQTLSNPSPSEMLYELNKKASWLFSGLTTSKPSTSVLRYGPTFTDYPLPMPTPKFEFNLANDKSEVTNARPKLHIAQRHQGTTGVPFKPVFTTDVLVKAGVSHEINVTLQCITCMNFYIHKSQEELRLADYINTGILTKEGKRKEKKVLFGTISPGTTLAQFKPLVAKDVILKYWITERITVNHQCITFMKEYEHKSLEELRLEDYIINGRVTKEYQNITAFFDGIKGVGSTLVQFKPLEGTDVIVNQQINIKHQCITSMKEYEDKSLEELRLEDYSITSRVGINYSGKSGFTQKNNSKWFFEATSKKLTCENQPKIIATKVVSHRRRRRTAVRRNASSFSSPVRTSPVLFSKAPTQTLDTPTEAWDSPTKAQDSPTKASDTPTQARDSPNQMRDTPTQARDPPTQTSKTPTQAPDSPTQARDSPTQTRQAPTRARETLIRMQETSAQRFADEKKAVGDRFFVLHNYKEAVNMYSEAISLFPENPVYLTDRANAFIKMTEHRKALEDAKKAVALDQKFTAGYIHIAQCCLYLGEVESGERAARRANELVPSIADPELVKLENLSNKQENARQLMEQEKYYEAHSVLTFCLNKLSPLCSKTKLMKAECMAYMRKFEDSRHIAWTLSRLNGFDAEAIYILGLCSYLQENDEQAIKYFQNVLQYAPDHEKAKKMYKMTKTRKNNAIIKQIKQWGNDAFNKGNYTKALNKYNEALAIDKNNKDENAKLYYNTAIVYAKLGRIREAIEACTAALELDEKYLKALLKRAQCYTELKKYEKAMEDYEKLYYIESNDENKRLLYEANKLLRARIGANYYYKVLEIEKNADKDDIKKAYRDKARLYHPDKHAGASLPVIRKNERKFKEVKEAYDVLSDPKRRANYDRYQKNDDSDNSYESDD